MTIPSGLLVWILAALAVAPIGLACRALGSATDPSAPWAPSAPGATELLDRRLRLALVLALVVNLGCALGGLGLLPWLVRPCFDAGLLTYLSKDWYVPQALLRGERLYVDVAWLYGPLPPTVTAAVGKIFSAGEVGWGTYQSVLVALNSGSIIVTYGLTRRMFTRSGGGQRNGASPRGIDALVTILWMSSLFLSIRGTRHATTVYAFELCLYLGVLALGLYVRRGRARLVGQGALLGLAWLTKAFAPAALLAALGVAEAWELLGLGGRFARRQNRVRLVVRVARIALYRSFVRGIGFLAVLIGGVGGLALSGVPSSRIADVVFPYFVRQMYAQEKSTFLQQFILYYFRPDLFPPTYFVLRLVYYVTFALGLAALLALLARGRTGALGRLPPAARRTALIGGLFWVLSQAIIWGQGDNHRSFDVMLWFAPAAVLGAAQLPVARGFGRGRLSRWILVASLTLVCLGFFFTTRLEFGSAAGSLGCTQRPVAGVPVTSQAAELVRRIHEDLDRHDTTGKPDPLLILSNGGPGLYEALGRTRPWRHHAFLWGQDRGDDFERLETAIRGSAFFVLADEEGWFALFGARALDAAQVDQVADPRKRELFVELLRGSELLGTYTCCEHAPWQLYRYRPGR